MFALRRQVHALSMTNLARLELNYGLETRHDFAILASMNAFRAIVLLLLVAVVGLMFYIVTVFLPDQQERYDVYQAVSKQQEKDALQEAHENRLKALAADTESEEEAQARKEAESRAEELKQQLNEAEEQSVIAAAKRKEAAAQARAAAAEANKPKALGAVSSYDAEWNALMFTPVPDAEVTVGMTIAVNREGKMVCEAVVDSRDEQSGQFSATVKPIKMSDSAGIPAENFIPRAGDGVIVSPLNAIDQSINSYVNPNALPVLPPGTPSDTPATTPDSDTSSAASLPAGEEQSSGKTPEEVEVNWIPVP